MITKLREPVPVSTSSEAISAKVIEPVKCANCHKEIKGKHIVITMTIHVCSTRCCNEMLMTLAN